jgi:hypothetical protein
MCTFSVLILLSLTPLREDSAISCLLLTFYSSFLLSPTILRFNYSYFLILQGIDSASPTVSCYATLAFLVDFSKEAATMWKNGGSKGEWKIGNAERDDWVAHEVIG